MSYKLVETCQTKGYEIECQFVYAPLNFRFVDSTNRYMN